MINVITCIRVFLLISVLSNGRVFVNTTDLFHLEFCYGKLLLKLDAVAHRSLITETWEKILMSLSFELYKLCPEKEIQVKWNRLYDIHISMQRISNM